MKLKFQGWNRVVVSHNHDVLPVEFKGKSIYALPNRKALTWKDGLTAFGKVEFLSLGGDFLVEFKFTEKELRNWLRAYIRQDVDKALRLIAAVQADGVKHLKKKAQPGRG